METEEKVDKLLDYVYSLQKKIKDEMLSGFSRLAEHHAEMSKITSDLIDIEIAFKVSKDQHGERVRTRNGDRASCEVSLDASQSTSNKRDTGNHADSNSNSEIIGCGKKLSVEHNGRYHTCGSNIYREANGNYCARRINIVYCNECKEKQKLNIHTQGKIPTSTKADNHTGCICPEARKGSDDKTDKYNAKTKHSNGYIKAKKGLEELKKFKL